MADIPRASCAVVSELSSPAEKKQAHPAVEKNNPEEVSADHLEDLENNPEDKTSIRNLEEEEF